jgi:ribosomal protein S18 acetylase RimI-like enzyme
VREGDQAPPLRAATERDAAAIAAVLVAAGQAAWGHIGPVEQMDSTATDWEARLRDASTALVAEDGGEVVGFAFTGAGCELQYLHVHPRAWGRGVGRALLAAAEDALRSAGCTEATLYTEERNHRALRLYAAAGWYPDGDVRERDWLGSPIREPRLRKRL